MAVGFYRGSREGRVSAPRPHARLRAPSPGVGVGLMARRHFGRAATAALVLGCIGFVLAVTGTGCGGGGGGGGVAATSGTVTTHLSDPPTCMAPTGNLESVWVTITKVRAHLSSSAG